LYKNIAWVLVICEKPDKESAEIKIISIRSLFMRFNLLTVGFYGIRAPGFVQNKVICITCTR
jgi:hypothetical protein